MAVTGLLQIDASLVEEKEEEEGEEEEEGRGEGEGRAPETTGPVIEMVSPGLVTVAWGSDGCWGPDLSQD